MTSPDAIRFSSNRNTRWPGRLIADMAATPPRFPVTVALGVWPQGARVLPKNAVSETLDSS